MTNKTVKSDNFDCILHCWMPVIHPCRCDLSSAGVIIPGRCDLSSAVVIVPGRCDYPVQS